MLVEEGKRADGARQTDVRSCKYLRPPTKKRVRGGQGSRKDLRGQRQQLVLGRGWAPLNERKGGGVSSALFSQLFQKAPSHSTGSTLRPLPPIQMAWAASFCSLSLW